VKWRFLDSTGRLSTTLNVRFGTLRFHKLAPAMLALCIQSIGVLVRQNSAGGLIKNFKYCIKILTFISNHVLMHMLFAKRENRV
jgi:hypothetical protein